MDFKQPELGDLKQRYPTVHERATGPPLPTGHVIISLTVCPPYLVAGSWGTKDKNAA